jgi:hypothetical protein
VKDEVYAAKTEFDFPFGPFWPVVELGKSIGRGDPYLALRACARARGFGFDDGPDMVDE